MAGKGDEFLPVNQYYDSHRRNIQFFFEYLGFFDEEIDEIFIYEYEKIH